MKRHEVFFTFCCICVFVAGVIVGHGFNSEPVKPVHYVRVYQA